MKASTRYYVSFDKNNPKTSKYPPYDLYYRLRLHFEWKYDDGRLHELQVDGCLLNYHASKGLSLSMPRVRNSKLYVALMNDDMKKDIIEDIKRTRPDVIQVFLKHEEEKPKCDDTLTKLTEEE